MSDSCSAFLQVTQLPCRTQNEGQSPLDIISYSAWSHHLGDSVPVFPSLWNGQSSCLHFITGELKLKSGYKCDIVIQWSQQNLSPYIEKKTQNYNNKNSATQQMSSKEAAITLLVAYNTYLLLAKWDIQGIKALDLNFIFISLPKEWRNIWILKKL